MAGRVISDIKKHFRDIEKDLRRALLEQVTSLEKKTKKEVRKQSASIIVLHIKTNTDEDICFFRSVKC